MHAQIAGAISLTGFGPVRRRYELGGTPMHYGKIVCGSLLGVAALTTPALAQETRSVQFGVQATVAHDSNVARSDAATAAIRGI